MDSVSLLVLLSLAVTTSAYTIAYRVDEPASYRAPASYRSDEPASYRADEPFTFAKA